MQLTLEGIVLRQYKADEDRILHILTSRFGVITAYANGAAKPRSPLAGSTELLCYSSFVLFHHKERYVVDKADSNRIFFGIRGDIEKLALASYLAQLSNEVCPHGVEADAHLRLLLNALHYIEKGLRPPGLLKALFELRILTLSGFMPDLVACRECAAYEAARMRFFPDSGSLLCGDCHTNAPGGIPLSPGILAAMRHIVFSPAEKLFAFTLSDEGIAGLAGLSETYLHYQIDKTFPALEFYRGLGALPAAPRDTGR